MMYPIEVHNLHKSYGRLKVLRGLSLRVRQGEIYGVLGQNGSGKSTLIHLLMGFLKPLSGTLSVLGTSSPEEAHGQIGYLPEHLRYHLRYSAREYLYFLGQMNDADRKKLHTHINEELARVGLSEVADRKMTTYSKGMLQRVGIAQALLNKPPLLLLDEPATGLDLVSRHELFKSLRNERAHGHTILICTHHIDIVENICDRVGILAGGRLAIELDVHQMRGISTSVNIQVRHLAPPLQEKLRALSSAVHCGNHIITLRPNTSALQEAVLQTLLDAKVAIVALEPLERPLEHVYLEAVRRTSLGEQVVLLSFPPEPEPANTEQPHADDTSEPAEEQPTEELEAEAKTTTKTETEETADTLLRDLLKKSEKQPSALAHNNQPQESSTREEIGEESSDDQPEVESKPPPSSRNGENQNGHPEKPEQPGD